MFAELNDGSAGNVNNLTVGLLKLNKSGGTVGNIGTQQMQRCPEKHAAIYNLSYLRLGNVNIVSPGRINLRSLPIRSRLGLLVHKMLWWEFGPTLFQLMPDSIFKPAIRQIPKL